MIVITLSLLQYLANTSFVVVATAPLQVCIHFLAGLCKLMNAIMRRFVYTCSHTLVHVRACGRVWVCMFVHLHVHVCVRLHVQSVMQTCVGLFKTARTHVNSRVHVCTGVRVCIFSALCVHRA